LLTGWFGPIGIAALFYATLAVRQTEDDLIWVVGSLLICASIVAHGISATPLTKWWGRQQQLHQESPQQEK
jgi:NhaP-type Na+/H+ or K+/H+ antiporter